RWSVRAIAEFVHKKKSSVQNRLGLVKDAAVAEAVLREQIPPTAGFHILRLPTPEREPYLRAAIAQRRTVEQIRTDVERRPAPRRPVQVVRLDGGGPGDDAPGPPGESAADGPAGGAAAAGALPVRAHLRRRAGALGDRHAREAELGAERTRL